ncbi:MAG: amino acid adenylation domain-containing protein [Gemmatimonadales bacterium]
MTDPLGLEHEMDVSSEDLGLLDQLLADAGVPTRPAATPIQARHSAVNVPLSFAQELLWLLDRASPGMTAYQLPMIRRLIGSLDVHALERSLTTVVARHEPLRTRFVATDGEPEQIIDPPHPVHLTRLDLRSSVNPEREAERAVRELVAKPFDLAAEPMFRATLLQIGGTDHLLLLDTHHIVFDGWSRDILFRELARCYNACRRGETPALAPLSIQFADFAVWQREQLAGNRLATLLSFWRHQLGDLTEVIDLPTDQPRTAVPAFAGGRCKALLPTPLLAGIKQFARESDATLYMVLLAAYMTVLHRYGGSPRVLVGSGSAGRTQAETEGLIGYFSNTLVQCGVFSGDPTFASLLAQVRESALGGYDHQELPLEKLALELREGRQLSDAPLFRAVLTMQDALEPTVKFDGLQIQPFGIDVGTTKFDLTLLPAECKDGLWLTLQYRSDLYQEATAQRFLGHLSQVLGAAVTDATRRVSRLPLLTGAEVAQLAAWNATKVDFGSLECVHRRFEQVAVRTPDAVAVVCGADRLTYQELEWRANQVARQLGSVGVVRGTPVGIALDRSAGAIVALLAVLKAGGCYVPLAVDAPPARLARQLAESATRFVVTVAGHVGRLGAEMTLLCLDRDTELLDRQPTDAPGIAVTGDDVAYVLFTSGSTGVPKGVAVSHGNIANYTSAMARTLGLESSAPLGFATVSTLAADLGNTAIFPALTTGGTLHVLPDDIALDGVRFSTYARAERIDVLKITPSHLRAVMSAAGPAAGDLLPRQWLVLGGEACPWDLVDEVRRIGRCQVLNHYGPTETTVGASTYLTAARENAPLSATVPIGLPLPNVQLHVLDVALQVLPIGIPGELHVGGAGVAHGYVNRPDLTAERFIETPAMGRLYRTGDRVRRLPDGALEFVGRQDGQVKIRGYRVELGEIEQVLTGFPGVNQSVVVWEEKVSTLIGYVVARTSGYSAAHGERPTSERLCAWVAERLPDHMVPTRVIVLDQLPLTANGKLDRAALPSSAAEPAGEVFAAPRTPTEITLATIWTDALKRPTVGVHDNFFELGGHSLIAIRVLGKVSRAFGVRLTLRALFDAPTIEQLGGLLDVELQVAALDRLNTGAPASPSGQGQ